MFIHDPHPHEPRGGQETPRDVAQSRRKWLRAAGYLTGGAAIAGGWMFGRQWWQGNDREVIERGRVDWQAGQIRFSAPRDEQFAYGREETPRAAAARYANFYEFTRTKAVWRFVQNF